MLHSYEWSVDGHLYNLNITQCLLAILNEIESRKCFANKTTAQKTARLRKLLRPQSHRTSVRYLTNRIHFKILRQRTEMMHQRRVSCSVSRVTERAVGESRQRPPLTFMLEEDKVTIFTNRTPLTMNNTEDYQNYHYVNYICTRIMEFLEF